MSNDIKKKYQIEHPIDWSQDRCCLCTFPLEINPTTYEVDEKTMSYSDFIIFNEHKFLKNIFSSDELAKTAAFLQNVLNSCEEFNECFNDGLLVFSKKQCADCSDFAELKDIISDVKIKNSRSGCKIPKFTLQIYEFVYQRLMDFPLGRFDYQTFTTIIFFENIPKIINVKIHLHHHT